MQASRVVLAALIGLASPPAAFGRRLPITCSDGGFIAPEALRCRSLLPCDGERECTGAGIFELERLVPLFRRKGNEGAPLTGFPR